MDACYCSVILNSQIKIAAIGVGKSNNGIKYLIVRKLFHVAFEFDRNALFLGYNTHGSIHLLIHFNTRVR